MLARFDRLSFMLGIIFSLIMLVVFSVVEIDSKSKQQTSFEFYSDHDVQIERPNSDPKSYLSERVDNSAIVIAQFETNEDETHLSEQKNPVLDNWQTLLHNAVSEQEALTLSELSVYQVAKDINESDDVFNAVLKQISSLEQGEQRAFLLRSLSDTNADTRTSAVDKLLSSSRTLDKKAGISLLMLHENTSDKTMLVQFLLQTESNEEVLKNLLAHISSNNDPLMITNSFNELQELAQFHHNVEIRGLAIKTMIKAQPHNTDIFEQLQRLMASHDTDESYQGVNLLNLQLNDYGISVSDDKKYALIEQLNWIAVDAEQTLDNRIKALSNLKILAEHY